MAITVADIQTNLNTFISDSSTDRISAAERLQAITEATSWLMETTQNDHQNQTYILPFFDTVNRYKVTTAIADLFDAIDIQRKIGDQIRPFVRSGARDILIDIANSSPESIYAIERKDNQTNLLINHDSKYQAVNISKLTSLTADGGTWIVDSTTSDATNLTIDNFGSEDDVTSFNFDVDVSQSGNNKATILNSVVTSKDLSVYENLGSFIYEIEIPDVTNIQSLTFIWGSSTSNYYTSTVTTDFNGNSFVNGKNTIKHTWSTASITGIPVTSAITYYSFTVNYGAPQADDTDFRLYNLRLVRPENLEFVYTSYRVGTNNSGTDIQVFGATTDIPYFSGQYDNYKFPVAHMAASLIYDILRLSNEATKEEQKAILALRRISNSIPSSKMPEQKAFKVKGILFNKFGRRRTNRGFKN